MEILQLIVKKENFDKIISGEIKEEVRPITSTAQSKYLVLKPNEVTLRIYDAILFKAGHEFDAPQALVKVVNTELDYVPDEDGYIQLFEEDGKLIIEDARMYYSLGDVIETNYVQ